MKSLLLAAVAAVAVGAGAETTTYTWDGTSTAYGDKVTVAYDENGKVTKLMSSVPKDDKVVFVGGTAEFAADAVISLASVGPLVFSNRVVTAGGVTVESAVVDTVIGGEDRGFIMGVSKVLPITFADFDELRIESAVISYMSGSTQVNLDNSRFFYVTREPDRQTMQLQEFNGAWTRCVKIEMTPSDEGVVVTSVYARQTSDYGVNHEGEDFDAPTFKYSDTASLFLTKVKISVDCSPALRQVHFAGELEAGGAVTVSKSANVFATGTALGAVDDATCDLGVNFDKGTFTFLDCGYFTYAGTVTGNTGSLIFGSSDAEPQASQEVFLDNLTKTDQTVAYGASLASLTGVTAVVRWNRYNDATLEDVMKDEFRGDLPAAFFRNLGDETVVRFQAMSKTWGSLMNSAAVRFRQDGTNIVARTVATYDQWTDNVKVKDPWLWDAVNDNNSGRYRDAAVYLRALSNVVLRLDCPKGDVNWDTRMTLACADSSTGVKKDTKGVRAKNGNEAHSRQLRVMNFFKHCSLDGKGTPVPRALGVASPAKEYATCRRIIFRHGAGSAVDRIRRLCPGGLKASEEARSALDYLDKRRGNMRYGWLRRNGYCISSSHVEAAARILVARRCKQAGMHWRHHNAAYVCAIIAKIRSAA